MMLQWCELIMRILVFFFKQKTAYDMRISDWSSDVCSSDLWRWIVPTLCLVTLPYLPESSAALSCAQASTACRSSKSSSSQQLSAAWRHQIWSTPSSVSLRTSSRASRTGPIYEIVGRTPIERVGREEKEGRSGSIRVWTSITE